MPDLTTLFDQISAMSPLAFAGVAFAGLIMGVAPSSLPLYAIVVGYVTSPEDEKKLKGRRRGLYLSSGFVLGMATVDAAVGALFGFLGSAVIQTLTNFLVLTNLLLALLLVVVGLALLRKIRIVFPALRPVMRRVDSFPTAYALGIPFGLSACPACAPTMLPILGAAAATGEPWLSAVLLFTFGFARGVPLVVAGTATGGDHARPAGGQVGADHRAMERYPSGPRRPVLRLPERRLRRFGYAFAVLVRVSARSRRKKQ